MGENCAFNGCVWGKGHEGPHEFRKRSEEEADNPIPFRPSIMLGLDPNNNLVCVLGDLPDEPGVVGVYMADLVRHVANAYLVDSPIPESEHLGAKAYLVTEIARVFNSELSAPTAEVQLVTNAGRLRSDEEGGIFVEERPSDD